MPANITLDVVWKTFFGFGRPKHGDDHKFKSNYLPEQTGRITLSSIPDQLLEKPQHKIPHAATTV